MRLVLVEMRRLLARRLVKWLTILVILGFGLAAVIVFINSDGSFRFTEMTDVLTGLSFPMVSLGLLLGASGIGAEWAHRTMTASLTWEPRRGVLLASKYAAIGIMALLWSTLLMAVLLALMWLVASARGTLEGVDATWAKDTVEVMLRVGLMTTIGALMGAGLATVGRNTAAALGVAFGYIIVIENLVRGFKPEWSDWLFGDNAARFILGSEDMGVIEHTQLSAGLVLVAYGLGCALVGWAFFRNREVA